MEMRLSCRETTPPLLPGGCVPGLPGACPRPLAATEGPEAGDSGGPPGRAAPRYLVVPGAGGEEVGGLQRGGGQGPPSGLADLLRHEPRAHLLHGAARLPPLPRAAWLAAGRRRAPRDSAGRGGESGRAGWETRRDGRSGTQSPAFFFFPSNTARPHVYVSRAGQQKQPQGSWSSRSVCATRSHVDRAWMRVMLHNASCWALWSLWAPSSDSTIARATNKRSTQSSGVSCKTSSGMTGPGCRARMGRCCSVVRPFLRHLPTRTCLSSAAFSHGQHRQLPGALPAVLTGSSVLVRLPALLLQFSCQSTLTSFHDAFLVSSAASPLFRCDTSSATLARVLCASLRSWQHLFS